MDDQPDDKLKQRIKKVFDNYEDPSADAGWLRLREKFPERRRRRAVLWLWPAAAAILLFLGLATWMYGINSQHIDKKKITYRVKTIKKAQPGLAQKSPVIAYQKRPDIKYKGKVDPAYNTTSNVGQIKQTSLNPVTATSKQRTPIEKQVIPVNPEVNNPTQAVIAPKTDQIASINTDSKQKMPESNILGLVAGARQKATVPDTPVNQTAMVKPKPTKSIEDMFAADQSKTGSDVKVNTDKKVLFGVYAATYFNYAKGSNNQVNVGAGFTADITLTGNLKLVTGLSVNQNSFAYNNSDVFAASFPAPSVYNNNGSAISNNYTQDASLVGLDIPLDLKYVLNSRKNQFYFLAGVGSGTFINESYSYLNTDGGVTASQSSGKGFNDFYFARTLNMALGVGYPLGKDQIVIEPFVKYPLQGLGAEQLRFGASGINLKFNFSIKK